jgi:hypothetical protein
MSREGEGANNPSTHIVRPDSPNQGETIPLHPRSPQLMAAMQRVQAWAAALPLLPPASKRSVRHVRPLHVAASQARGCQYPTGLALSMQGWQLWLMRTRPSKRGTPAVGPAQQGDSPWAVELSRPQEK